MANSARKIRYFKKKKTHAHTQNTNLSALKLLYNRKIFWALHKAGESEFAKHFWNVGGFNSDTTMKQCFTSRL